MRARHSNTAMNATKRPNTHQENVDRPSPSSSQSRVGSEVRRERPIAQASAMKAISSPQ